MYFFKNVYGLLNPKNGRLIIKSLPNVDMSKNDVCHIQLKKLYKSKVLIFQLARGLDAGGFNLPIPIKNFQFM